MFLISTGSYRGLDRALVSEARRGQLWNGKADFARQLAAAQKEREQVSGRDRPLEEDAERWDGLA